MKKILLLGFSLLTVVVLETMAQRVISGKVTDDSGEGLPGVNVIIKGTTTGANTDLEGNYRLSVDDGATLIFSFVGFESQEVEIGSRTTIDISMSGATELKEVVITALGISREKASLGYGVTNIDSDALVNKQDADVARLLRGRATGVNITSTSGLAGSGTNVVIRGYSSITGSNQPFFVVDGIPFDAGANTGGQGFGTGSATASSRFLDLDPNNIADISILKGLSATVLYGEAGRNGVILITTKTGQGNVNLSKKTEITVRQSVYKTQIANLPDYQNSYGNGFNAGFGWFFSNWGPRFSDTRESSYGDHYKGLTGDGRVLITHPYDQTQYHDDFGDRFKGAEYVYQPYTGAEDFFQKGTSSNTSVSITSRVNENSSVSFSYSYLTEDGFTPRLDSMRGGGRSNFLDKHNFSFGGQTKLNNGLKLQSVFNFVKTDRLSPITAPAFGGDGNGLFAAVLFTPRSIDLMNLPYQSPIDGSNVYYRRGSPIQNPRWTLNNSGQSESIRRFFGNINLSYDLGDNFSILYRLSLDHYDQVNKRYINKGGVRQPNGEYETYNTSNTLTDQIFNVVYQFQVLPKISIDGILGFNARRSVNGNTFTTSEQQFIYDVFNHQNFVEHRNSSFLVEENTLGAYLTTTIGYSGFLYLNLQGRHDWTSTLEPKNRSVFYPSASLSFVLSDALPSLSDSRTVDLLKLRVGYGTSAGYPAPYSTRSVLSARTNVFIPSEGSAINISGVDSYLGNPNLKSELIKEIEVGLEGKFLKNKIGLDVSLYRKTSDDLIVDLPLDPSTGYDFVTLNSANLENKGIELGMDFLIPISGDFSWQIRYNYTKNISKVVSIREGVNRIQLDARAFDRAGFNRVGNYAIEGQPYGVFYGEQFKKNDQGLFIVDVKGGYQKASNFGQIGDPNPDYNMNFFNTFSWKGISLSFHFQYIKGGDIWSSTAGALLARGNSVDSDINRPLSFVLPNSVKENGAPNDIQVHVGDQAFNSFFGGEGFLLDGTVIRLRQISLGYTLPKKLLANTPFGNASIVFSGENLWYNAPNTPKGINFDPEVSSTGIGNSRGMDFRTAPTAKKYGVSLSLTF